MGAVHTHMILTLQSKQTWPSCSSSCVYSPSSSTLRTILSHEQSYFTPRRIMMSSAPSSIAPHSSSNATSDAVTAPSVGKAATGSPLVRAILESYGKEILESASEQFLDLAVEVRLQTISARQLVKLLANANRLGYQETDIVDDENGARPVQGGNANSRSKPDATDCDCWPVSPPLHNSASTTFPRKISSPK